jgi:hypothetical protein
LPWCSGFFFRRRATALTTPNRTLIPSGRIHWGRLTPT